MMSNVPEHPQRWLVRTGVALTALLCLGVAGYAGQVWWAREVAKKLPSPLYETGILRVRDRTTFQEDDTLEEDEDYACILSTWKTWPWHGRFELSRFITVRTNAWIPRRAFREVLTAHFGVDLGDDPSAWESWIRSHPILLWDKQEKRYVARARPIPPPPSGPGS